MIFFPPYKKFLLNVAMSQHCWHPPESQEPLVPMAWDRRRLPTPGGPLIQREPCRAISVFFFKVRFGESFFFVGCWQFRGKHVPTNNMNHIFVQISPFLFSDPRPQKKERTWPGKQWVAGEKQRGKETLGD